jgi:hypothetical protein
LVLAQQLTSQDVAIFGDDLNEPIRVFGMIPDQLRQPLHLALQALKSPEHLVQAGRGLAFLCDPDKRRRRALPGRKSLRHPILVTTILMGVVSSHAAGVSTSSQIRLPHPF